MAAQNVLVKDLQGVETLGEHNFSQSRGYLPIWNPGSVCVLLHSTVNIAHNVGVAHSPSNGQDRYFDAQSNDCEYRSLHNQTLF